ncbi:MAG: polysaccharide biosynthesis protein [Clostridia bacterium]|nr:polysaccharide biosynthesis protein [Clostridia bacterium]
MLGSNIFVKGLGFFYRVVLVRLLGVEGVGLVEMVSPVFSFLLVLGGCGIQTSLSQIVAAKQGSESHIYFRTALMILAISSTLLTAAAYFAAPWLVRQFAPDERILFCLQLILPAIIIICLASAFRGLFQGLKYVGAIGMSQNVEQITRVAVGIWLIGQMAVLALPEKVGAVSLATVCGEGIGFLYLLYVYFRGRKEYFLAPSRNHSFSFKAARELLALGLPLTASRLVSTGIMMLQAILIPLCLKLGGWDIRAATEIYGRFAGVALALLHLPGVFTSALSVSVLPAVAESMTYDITGRRLMRQRINDSLQAASSFTLLGMLLLFLFASPLCTLLFDNPPAAVILRILTIGGIFLYLQVTLISVLQGLGEVKILLVNNIICGVVLISGILLLTPLPSLGISGAAIAVDISWLCGFCLNLYGVYRKAKIKLDWSNIALKPAAAALIVLLFYYSQQFFSPSLIENQNMTTMLWQGIMVIAVYLLSLILSGGLIKIRRQK